MSDEAIITEAQREAKESAPVFDIICSNVAIDALPEIGRVIISGKMSEGSPILLKSGASISLIKSQAPEAVNILTATIRAHIVGKSEKALLHPSFAPLINDEK